MDKKIREILGEKIRKSISAKDEITSLVNSLEPEDAPNKGFEHGIIVGRLYNSFYYQSRRILKRNPTEQEFSEFIELLKEHENEFLEISFS